MQVVGWESGRSEMFSGIVRRRSDRAASSQLPLAIRGGCKRLFLRAFPAYPFLLCVLASFASAAEPVELNFLWRPQLRDPADELMLEAAVNGRADALVTHNVGDFQTATARFGVRTLTPGAFLKEISR